VKAANDRHRRFAVLKSALLAATGLLVAAAPAPHHTGGGPVFDAEDVLAKTRAAYAALKSYADSGTVLDEFLGFTDRSTFRTLFIRNPRYLLIDHREVASEDANGRRLPMNNRTVLWMENGELHTWSNTTEAHETYPADAGQQVNALNGAAYGTAGISC
jgi:hypothetical protein